MDGTSEGFVDGFELGCFEEGELVGENEGAKVSSLLISG